MNASIKDLVNSGRSVKGLIHVGANDGEEVPHYQSLGIQNIALFEPLLAPFKTAFDKYLTSQVKVFNLGWFDKSGIFEMHVTENDKASSLYELIPVEDPANHPVLKDWNMGQLPVVGSERAPFVRFDEFVANELPEDFNVADYDCLVMDVQGAELPALKGMNYEINRINYLLIELSANPVYEGQSHGAYISSWLAGRGFTQRSKMALHDNVLFIRKGY